MRYERAIADVRLSCLSCIVLMLAGCASTPPELHDTYVVRPEDTLYSIAWRHDLDFRDLAKWNDVGPDYRIAVGQVLTLRPAPLSGRQGLEAGSGEPASSGGASRGAAGPATGTAPSALAQPPTAARSPNQPRVARPRSPAPDPAAAPAAAGSGRGAGTGASGSTGRSAGSNSGRGAMRVPGGAGSWAWPTEHAAPPRPVPGGGILLFGKLGQDVRAAGAGRVVYTGSGIRGYGNLIILRHGDNMLSSYAHNAEMLVHEGQDVSIGQIIAHMGLASHQTSALYFEIRFNGKPVDPLRYLPAVK